MDSRSPVNALGRDREACGAPRGVTFLTASRVSFLERSRRVRRVWLIGAPLVYHSVRPRTKPSGTFGNSKIDGLNFARLEEKMIRTGKKKVPSGKKSLSSVRNFLARNPRKTPIFFLTRRSEFILPVLLWFSRCIFCTVLKGACLRGHGVPGRPRIATS